MDVKDLRTETALSDRSSNGNTNTNNYAHNSISFQCTDKNKSYHDIGSNSLPKVDVQTTRPCAVIGPDRILPQPLSVNNPYMKRGHAEPWQFPRPPEYPQKMSEYQHHTRNISPRQTFQENMQRIMVPPRSLALEDTNFVSDKSDSIPKNISKLNMPLEGKYCDVPYTVNPLTNEKNTRSSVPAINPSLMRGVWPPSGMSARPGRPVDAPELYQYPDYTNCAPHTLPVSRPIQAGHEEPPVHMFSDPYRGGNIRYEPYPSVKERNPRYEYINYTNPYPSPHFPTHKYDVQKLTSGAAMPPQYAGYPQVPLKYVREPHGYQRSPNPQPNYNVPFHNQGVYSNYGSIPGNCLPNKLYPYPSEGNYNPALAPKPPYDNNKSFVKYDNIQMRHYPTSDNLYLNDLSRSHHMKTSLSMPGPMNMHALPSYPNYRKDNMPIRHYDLSGQFKNIDPTYNTQMSRIPSHFSPVESLNSENHSFGISPEDCGYVSQSSTTSVRSTDSGINMYHRYGHINRGSPIVPRNESEAGNKNKKGINVRQFLQMWNEGDEDNGENNTNKDIVAQTNVSEAKQNSELYVLGLVNVPCEELDKYEHIQKVSKLPDNIKGYTSIDLLNQFEEVIESSNLNNYAVRTSNSKEIQKQNSPSVHVMKGIDQPIRSISPLDVEAKISQSVIHKDVGCNFEIKPCSPKMLNVEAAAPVQTLIEERVIEKVTNQLVKSPVLANIEENTNNSHVIKRQDSRSQNRDDGPNVSSCKMVKTPYLADNTRVTDKSNYSIQDFESNSGVCLASLPRLDNDIELSFPEVNQQFINANAEVINNHKSTKTDNADMNFTNPSETKDIIINSPVSPFDTDFPKLSKYRKNKSVKDTSDNTPFLSVQATRTDSVIIKNPENNGNFSDDSSAPISFKHAEISFTDKIPSPINLAVNMSTSCANNNLNDLSDLVKEHAISVKTNNSESAINLSLNSITQDVANNSLSFENKEQKFEPDLSSSKNMNKNSSDKSPRSSHAIPDIIVTNEDCDQNVKKRRHLTELENFVKNKDDANKISSMDKNETKHTSGDVYNCNEDADANTENREYKLNEMSELEDLDYKSTNDFDAGANNEKLYRLLEERANDLPENLLTPLSDSTINDCSQDSLISDNGFENSYCSETTEKAENKSEMSESNLLEIHNPPSTLLSEKSPTTDDSCKTSLQTQLQAVLKERKHSENQDSYSVITKNYYKYQNTHQKNNDIDISPEENEHLNYDFQNSDINNVSEESIEINCKVPSFEKLDRLETNGKDKTKPDAIYESNKRENNNKSDKELDDELKHVIEHVPKSELKEIENDDYVSDFERIDNGELYGDNDMSENVSSQKKYKDKEDEHKTKDIEVVAVRSENNIIQDCTTNLDYTYKKDSKLENLSDFEKANKEDSLNKEFLFGSSIIEKVDDIKEEILTKESEMIVSESTPELNKEISAQNSNKRECKNHLLEDDRKSLLFSPKQTLMLGKNVETIDHATISFGNVDAEGNQKPENSIMPLNLQDFSTKSTMHKKLPFPFHKELYSSEVQKLLVLQEGYVCKSFEHQLKHDAIETKIMKENNKEVFDSDAMVLKSKDSQNHDHEEIKLNTVLNNDEMHVIRENNENVLDSNPTELKSEDSENQDNEEITFCKVTIEEKSVNTELNNAEIYIIKENSKDGFDSDTEELKSKDSMNQDNEEIHLSKINTEEENLDLALNNDENQDEIKLMPINHENTQDPEDADTDTENEFSNLELESSVLPALENNVSDIEKDEEIENKCDDCCEETLVESSLYNNVKQQTVNCEKLNKFSSFSTRRTLKRALSESAIYEKNGNSKDEEFSQTTNKSSLWPNKRKKTDDNLNDDSNSSVQNRRNSISSVYHEENISFCILIDNNCLIAQDEYTEGTVCFADIQEEDFSSATDNQFVSEDVECQPDNIYAADDEPIQILETESYPVECITLKEPEVNWVDDVACVETVVSDDVDEDDDVFVENSSTPRQDEDIFDHTNKLKNIYGDEMGSDDIHLIKTLYSTPQMDMNKTLQVKESLILESSKQYENDCLESILSDTYVGETKNHYSKFTEPDFCSLDGSENDPEEQVCQENYESISFVCNEELNKRDKCLEENLEGLERDLSEFPCVYTAAHDNHVNSCESTSETSHLNASLNRLKYKRSSSSPEVTSTTEEKKSGILLKITNYNGSRTSHLDNMNADNSKRIRCKFTEDNDYSHSKTDSIQPRPLLTKAAQKYIPPLPETIRDLKVKLFLPQNSLVKLKQLKVSKDEPKTSNKHFRTSLIKNTSETSKKPKPKFEDVLKGIDEIQFKMHKEKKKLKNSIPKVIIKKTENGSHYASTSRREAYNPDLTGRKWQPWVFLEKNKFIDKMASRGKTKAVYCHRKKCYIFAERFKKYKSIYSSKFVISQPKSDPASAGPLKYTIKLKPAY